MSSNENETQSRGERRMSSKCDHCGARHSITSATLGPVEMVQRLDEAHALLNPDCVSCNPTEVSR